MGGIDRHEERPGVKDDEPTVVTAATLPLAPSAYVVTWLLRALSTEIFVASTAMRAGC